MKTLTVIFIAVLICFTTVTFAQNDKPVFENASFTRSADGTSRVQLNWKKGLENTAYYLVEKSSDGKEFRTAAVVFTSEDAQWTAYKYSDKNTGTSGKVVYYRIAVVGVNKELTYLPVQRVELSATTTTKITLLEGIGLAGK